MLPQSPGPHSFKNGDIVYGRLKNNKRCGTLSQYILVDPSIDCLFAKPDHLSVLEAACIGVASTTAYHSLVDHCGFLIPRPHRHLAVIGASGGVGSMVVQMAKALDPSCYVTAVCSEKNIPYVISLGADDAVAYDTPLEDDEMASRSSKSQDERWIKMENLEFSGEYDSVIDLSGHDSYLSVAMGTLLVPRGVYSCPVKKATSKGAIVGRNWENPEEAFTLKAGFIGRWISKAVGSFVGMHKKLNAPVRIFRDQDGFNATRFAEVDAVIRSMTNLKVQPTLFPFGSVGDAFDLLLKGGTPGKVVVHVDMEGWLLASLSRRVGRSARVTQAITISTSVTDHEVSHLEEGGENNTSKREVELQILAHVESEKNQKDGYTVQFNRVDPLQAPLLTGQ